MEPAAGIERVACLAAKDRRRRRDRAARDRCGGLVDAIERRAVAGTDAHRRGVIGVVRERPPLADVAPIVETRELIVVSLDRLEEVRLAHLADEVDPGPEPPWRERMTGPEVVLANGVAVHDDRLVAAQSSTRSQPPPSARR